MARLNEEAQWIVMMEFIVSFRFFFLALVINQPTVVCPSTAESVSEFPKTDIRETTIETAESQNLSVIQSDISNISLYRRNAVVGYKVYPANSPLDPYMNVVLHYNNGVTAFNENRSAV